MEEAFLLKSSENFGNNRIKKWIIAQDEVSDIVI